MSGEVIKYHNDLNTVPMRSWTAEEMDFFFAIVAKLRDKGTQEITLNRTELSRLVNYAGKNVSRFRKTMERLVKKIGQLYYFEKTSNSFKYMALFESFEVAWNDDLTDMSAKISVTHNFEYILNKLSIEFTSWELEEFVELKSTYAKTAYRLLKQWRTVGKKEFDIEKFRLLFDIPKSYGISSIDRRVIKPILKELPPYFPNIKVKKVKANTHGTPVIGYIFNWKPEIAEKWVEGKFDQQAYKAKDVTPAPKEADLDEELSNADISMLLSECNVLIKSKYYSELASFVYPLYRKILALSGIEGLRKHLKYVGYHLDDSNVGEERKVAYLRKAAENRVHQLQNKN